MFDFDLFTLPFLDIFFKENVKTNRYPCTEIFVEWRGFFVCLFRKKPTVCRFRTGPLVGLFFQDS